MSSASEPFSCPAAADPARLTALAASGLPDSEPEETFDRLTRFASRLLDVPVALVSLVDARRQFFKSAVGLPEPWATCRETPLSHSFCQHVVGAGEALLITDAREDERVADNGAVKDLGVIAYAGVPLIDPDGYVLGAFCAIDGKPRAWSEDDLAILRSLSDLAATELRLRAINRRLNDENVRLEAAVTERTAELETTAEDLRHAADALANASVSERDRLARVLHDHLQQILVGAKMTLAAGGPREDAIGFIDEAITESRTLAAELSPPVLRSHGLAAALEWLGGRALQRHNLRMSVQCDSSLSDRLPPGIAAMLFDASRELLLNSVKHAAATTLSVRLTTIEHDGAPAAVLTMVDDGRGFPEPNDAVDAPDGDVSGDGFGLADLRHRVGVMNGELSWKNRSEGGAAVKVVLPMPSD